MKRFAQRIFLACAFIWLQATAQAQPFPADPIGIVVPLAPGDVAALPRAPWARSYRGC